MSSKSITHQGIIESIEGTLIKVRIVNLSACASCHAKGACSASDQEEKIIDVVTNRGNYKVGQQVTISSKTEMGFKALFYGYVLPFIIVFLTLILLTILSFSETLSGLISLGILIPYYFILYLFRQQLGKSFTFEIL